MKIEDYRRELIEAVGVRAEADAEPLDRAFVSVCASILEEFDALTGFEPAYFRGIGERRSNLGVDGYCLVTDDDSVEIVIADYSGLLDGTWIPTMGKSQVDKLFGLARNFVRDSLRGDFAVGREPSDPAVQLSRDLADSRSRLRRITVNCLSDTSYQRTAIRETEVLEGVQVEFRLWDITRLHEAHTSASGRDELQINMPELGYENGLPALATHGDDFDTYLLTVPASLLAQLYEDHGNRLLESNVRSFLSARGKVNKGIRATLEGEPDRFLAYNNGITATATGIDHNGRSITSINNLQIVNGGQTTASLYYAQRDSKSAIDLTNVAVQMKLVVVDPSLAESLVPKISRYANSQNAVNEADFFSNSPFHIRLEQLSKRVATPSVSGTTLRTKWFYERARGQFQNDKAKLSKAAQKRFDAEYPKTQLITKTDAARYINSWNGLPHIVSRGTQKNFHQFAMSVDPLWNKDDTQFNERYFRELVALAILYRDLRKAVMKADWYRKGYLANIVTLTLARIGHEVGKASGSGSNFDFEAIWASQAVPSELLASAMEIAEAMLGVLESETRTKQNVTEWAKDEYSWTRAKAVPLGDPVIETIGRYIVAAEKVRGARRDAASLQETDNEIEVLTTVINTPASSWKSALEFLTRQRSLSPTEAGILQKLVRGGGTFVPSDRQGTVALRCLDRAKELGLRL